VVIVGIISSDNVVAESRTKLLLKAN